MKFNAIIFIVTFFLIGIHNLIAQPVLFLDKGDYNVLLIATGKKPGLEEKKVVLENRGKEDSLVINVQVCSDKNYFPTDANMARAMGEKVNANLIIWMQNNILNFSQVSYKGNSSIEQGTFAFSENCLIASVFSNYYYNEGVYQKAIENLIQLKECSDTVFSTHWMLANAYYETKDTANSMIHTKKLLRLKRYSDIASNLMGILLAEQGNFTKARNYFRDARGYSPNNPLYLKNLAMTCYQMEKWDYAYVHYKDLSQIWVDSLPVLFMTGMAASHLGSYSESSLWFEKVLALNDTSEITHYNQGHNMHLMGQLEKAIFHYSKVIELNPMHANAHLSLAYIYAELKKNEELKSYYQKAIELDPDLRNTKFEEEFDLK